MYGTVSKRSTILSSCCRRLAQRIVDGIHVKLSDLVNDVKRILFYADLELIVIEVLQLVSDIEFKLFKAAVADLPAVPRMTVVAVVFVFSQAPGPKAS